MVLDVDRELERVNALLDRVAAEHAGGRLAAAERLTRRALAAAEAAVGRRDVNLAPVLTTLGRIRADRGDGVEALRLYGRAAGLLARARSDAEARALEVDVRRAAGMLHVQRAEYEHATRELELALELAEKTFGRSHVEVARCLNGLGVVGKYTGRFAEASRRYRRALRIVVREVGEESEDASVLYHNLGGLEHARGRFVRGEPLARRGVEIRQRLVPAGDPSLSEDRAALAAILDGMERHAEAEKIYKDVLTRFRAHYGPVHYEVAVNLHNLAANQAAQGKLADADRLYLRALALKEKLLGRAHPDTALSLFNLGMLSAARGERALAARRVERARRVFLASLGDSHPHTREATRALERLRR